MTARICPICEKERDTRGFALHFKTCEEKAKLNSLKKTYANQLATMTQEQVGRFLRKAQGG